MGDGAGARMRQEHVFIRRQTDPKVENALLAATQQREHAMRRDLTQGFLKLKPISEI